MGLYRNQTLFLLEFFLNLFAQLFRPCASALPLKIKQKSPQTKKF